MINILADIVLTQEVHIQRNITAVTLASTYSGSCAAATTKCFGIYSADGGRALNVTAPFFSVRNIIFPSGSSASAAGGGCVYVAGDAEFQNCAFRGCTARTGVRARTCTMLAQLN